ncbi:MAG: O-antigen ligase family protein [Candidatus Promineifilaceae bacterium]
MSLSQGSLGEPAGSQAGAALDWGATQGAAERSWLERLALILLFLLAASLPFETEAGLALGPLLLTNLEALMLACVLLAGLLALRGGPAGWPPPRAWLLLWGLYAAGLLLAGLAAPEFQANALKAAGRSGLTLLLGLSVPQIVRRRLDLHWLAAGLAAGGLAAAVIGLGELAAGRPLAWLEPLRTQATAVGPFMRLSGSFNHANLAAMYFEATLPLLVIGSWLAHRRGRRPLALLAAGAAFIFLLASVLTYSRSSFATIALSNGLAAGLLGYASDGRRRALARVFLLPAGLVLLILAVNAWISPALRLRLETVGDNEWYKLRFEVPAEISAAAQAVVQAEVELANQGELTWRSDGETPIRVGGVWLRQDGSQAELGEARWSLPRPVAPGDSIALSLPLQAPSRPGLYWLEWDLVQEGVTWFSAKNGLVTRTLVKVGEVAGEQPPVAAGSSTTLRLAAAVVPGRTALWAVALRQLAARPLLGIGLDNFRLTYGRELGWPSWNDSIHTNNWYLETLVSLGLLGSLPFLAWLGLLAFELFRTIRRPAVHAWQVAVAVGLAAFMLHGLLDYFMLFNATAALFWLLVGGWLVVRPGEAPAAAG